MRYVVLLLIFCVSFGVLDSVPHPGARTGASYTTSTLSTIFSNPVVVTPEPGLIERGHHKVLLPAIRRRRAEDLRQKAEDLGHGTVTPVGMEPSPDTAAATAAPTRAIERPAAPAINAEAAPTSEDSAARSPVPASDIKLAPGYGEAPAAAAAESRLTLATLDASSAPVTLREFAKSAVDRTGTPFFRDTIRNLLMDPNGIRFGGMAGLNWSGASASGSGGRIGGRSLTGLTLGVFADVPLKKKLSLRTKAQYAYQGYQPVVNGQPVNIHIAYLHVAPDLVYHTDWLQRRLFVGVGPYAAYAVNGTYTLKGINTDMLFGNQAGANLRRMDYGLDGTAGLLMDRNFVLSAEVDWGVRNIALGDTRIHTRSVGLMVTYVFRNRSLF